ncbi:VOC family protein [Actinomadura sediminis]|uniref:VOC family protein n=1 Tax=Actinomadura sediminis TaxID=1038904 RepID=A0ABW3EP39_9ACTN
MPALTRRALGRPSWVELSSPDAAASRHFYCELFGWYAYTLTVPGQGDYHVFTLGDVGGPEVAGMRALADDTEPPSWTCYFHTDDLASTLDTVRAEGGQELVPPTDVSDLWRMAHCADSQGADFALWTPGRLEGAGVVDEPRAMCWTELACEDPEEAVRFYGEVFGWRAVHRAYYTDYVNFKVGDWSVGGLVALKELRSAGYRDPPAHWIPYIWVTDCDAATARAAELGARVLLPPTTIPPGRFAVLSDPTGARIDVITPAPGSMAERKRRP